MEGILRILAVTGVEDGAKDKESKTSGGKCSTILFTLILTAVLMLNKEF
jgi:hypothetical protein